MAARDVDFSGFPRPARALVVGASGGIGSALPGLLEAAEFDVCRASRDGAHGTPIDVTDEASIRQAFAGLRDDVPLRIVIVASGLLHDGDLQPEKSLCALDAVALARTFAVNAIGPALIAGAP